MKCHLQYSVQWHKKVQLLHQLSMLSSIYVTTPCVQNLQISDLSALVDWDFKFSNYLIARTFKTRWILVVMCQTSAYRIPIDVLSA